MFFLEGYSYETHLSAIGCASQAHPRFPGAHAHAWWSRSHSCPARQRSSSSRSLSWLGTSKGVAENFGFGAQFRLLQADGFGEVFAQRRVVRGRQFDLHYRPNGGASARLGLVIAKKLARRSVWRNAIKRTGREAFRMARAGLPAMDLVLRLAKPVAGVDTTARKNWRSEIETLLSRLPR